MVNSNNEKLGKENISMTEDEVKDLLRKYGVTTPDYTVVDNEREISALKMNYPVVLKVCSPTILHKTQVGGVKLNIKNKRLLIREFKEMKKKFPTEKFLVETMEESGLEIIVGLVRDQTFGLCIMFGLGGIFTEIFEDVIFRAVPITRCEAEEMVKDLKAKRVLEGFRGMKVDKESVVDLLGKISKLAVDMDDEIDQLDLNPIIVKERGLSVVDAKLIRNRTGTFSRKGEKNTIDPDILTPLLYPKSVALIGASANPGKIGYLVLRNILEGGFTGRIYPINAGGGEILGFTAKKNVLDVGEEIDLGIIVVPAEAVPQVVEECGERHVKGLLIISGGFSEAGPEGKELEKTLGGILEKYNMSVIGPNCQGVVNTNVNLSASFSVETLIPYFQKGSIALITQSGSAGSDFLQSANNERLGFSLWINVGNKLNLDESDYIRFVNEDSNVSVIAAYLEGVKDGRKFLKTIKDLRKPMVVLKSGRTKLGEKAAQSHTAALAGNDKIWDGVLRQNSIFRAESTEDLFDITKALSHLKYPAGRRLLVVESSGGLGTIASDIAENAGLELPDLDEEAKEKLRQFLPPFLVPGNPLDTTSRYMVGLTGESFEEAMLARIMDRYDAFLLIFGDPVAGASKVVAAFKRNTDKPIVVAFSGGGKVEEEERKKIYDLKVPVYPSVTRAMRYFQFCYRDSP